MSLLVPKKRNHKTLPGLLEDFMKNESLFDTSLFKFGGNMLDFENSFVVPEANILETEKEFKVELAAPGLEKKDFQIEIDNNLLKISVEKEERKEEDKENYHRREFCYNSFYRSFTLPDNLMVDKINATYTDGVLYIHMPKKEPVVAKATKHIKVG
jgi:HSP20 family protein